HLAAKRPDHRLRGAASPGIRTGVTGAIGPTAQINCPAWWSGSCGLAGGACWAAPARVRGWLGYAATGSGRRRPLRTVTCSEGATHPPASGPLGFAIHGLGHGTIPGELMLKLVVAYVDPDRFEAIRRDLTEGGVSHLAAIAVGSVTPDPFTATP